MPLFRVIEPSYLQPAARPDRDREPCRTYTAGETIEFADEPGPTLAPLDDDARALKAVALFAKALRPSLGGAHMAKLAWAKSIGVTAPSSIADAEAQIRTFIGTHHPDARVRVRFSTAPIEEPAQ